jgi:transposase
MRKNAEPKWRSLRPAYDHWVGVGHEVLRYVDRLEERIDAFDYERERAHLEHVEEVRRLQALLVERERAIGVLHQRVTVLEKTLATTSRNSSRPPSSDPLSAPKRPAAKRSRKRRGGQVGHPFHTRHLYAPELCASVTDHRPEQCTRCGVALEGDDPEPLRHQIVDLPVLVPTVEEHRLHSLHCGACGHRTRACLPEGVNATGFGPGVVGTVATLVAECRASHRTTLAVLRDFCGVRVGLGTVSTLLRRASRSVEAAVEEALAFVAHFDGAKHLDETSWVQRGVDGTNEDGAQAWLWVASTEPVTAFRIELSRKAEVAKGLVGELTRGVLVTDRFSAYSFASTANRQVCWAHLARDFTAMAERGGPSGRVGRGLLRVARLVFEIDRRYRAGKLSNLLWEYYCGRLRMRARAYLEQGARMDTKPGERSVKAQTKGTCKELLKLEPALWLFVGRPGVEVTNNRAERMLRHGVMLRKVSNGSQSSDGAEWMARLLTVVMTLRSRGENPHRFLVESSRAAIVKAAPPRLVPA